MTTKNTVPGTVQVGLLIFLSVFESLWFQRDATAIIVMYRLKIIITW